MNNQLEKIEGIVKQKKFHDEETGFYILNILLPDNKKRIVTGKNPLSIKINDCISAEGYTQMGKLNVEFRANLIDVVKPTKLETIRSYLTSGLIKGLTKKAANALVDTHGDQSIDIIENHPAELLKINGLGNAALTKIINSWSLVKPTEHNINELLGFGFSEREAIKIVKKFGEKALDILARAPYTLSNRIRSLSFEKVDDIALINGMEKHSKERMLAGVEYFLDKAHESGECLIEYTFFFARLSKYLKVDEVLLTNTINFGINSSFFFFYNKEGVDYIQSKKIKHAELEVSRRMYMLLKDGKVTNYQLKNIKRDGEKDVQLSDEQNNAVYTTINSKVSILTGGPGTGKTTVLNEMLKQLQELGRDILLCAPTGKAAQKMKESTGLRASTIHRLLDFNPRDFKFRVNESNPLVTDVIVIDESSMIDIFLMMHLLRAIDNKTQIIIVGDVNQLASVQAGSVLRDLIDTNVIKTSQLTQIFRQAKESKIITNAHAINNGDFNTDNKSNADDDFFFINSDSDEKTLSLINTIIDKKVKQVYNLDPKNDVQLLVPQHGGILGTVNLNKEMQERLNQSNGLELKTRDFTYKVGDKVIQTVNNYDKNVFNGDCGKISMIGKTGLCVSYDNLDEDVEYLNLEVEEISPSYCLSIHKSQGSEYPIVLIPLPQDYNGIIDRSLIYTGVTRGKQLVVLIGNSDVVNMGIQSESSRYRKTNLTETIVQILQENPIGE